MPPLPFLLVNISPQSSIWSFVTLEAYHDALSGTKTVCAMVPTEKHCWYIDKQQNIMETCGVIVR